MFSMEVNHSSLRIGLLANNTIMSLYNRLYMYVLFHFSSKVNLIYIHVKHELRLLVDDVT